MKNYVNFYIRFFLQNPSEDASDSNQGVPDSSVVMVEAWVDTESCSSTFEMPALQEDIDAVASQLHNASASAKTERKSLGKKLFDALFSGELLSKYQRFSQAAATQDSFLRIIFHFSDEVKQLARVPWELLWTKKDDYIFRNPKVTIVRTLDVFYRSPRPPISETPLRILGVLSSPSGLSSLDMDTERENLENALSNLTGLVELTWIESATWENLLKELKNGKLWHVIHFIGHGLHDTSGDSIVLCDSDGQPDPIEVTDVGKTLAQHQELRLVYLNTCHGAHVSEHTIYSSLASQLLLHGVPAVVAMQHSVTDSAAISISEIFYREIANGAPLDEAIAKARSDYRSKDLGGWANPVLLMRTTSQTSTWSIMHLPKEPELEEVLSSFNIVSAYFEKRDQKEDVALIHLLAGRAALLDSDGHDHRKVLMRARSEMESQGNPFIHRTYMLTQGRSDLADMRFEECIGLSTKVTERESFWLPMKADAFMLKAVSEYKKRNYRGASDAFRQAASLYDARIQELKNIDESYGKQVQHKDNQTVLPLDIYEWEEMRYCLEKTIDSCRGVRNCMLQMSRRHSIVSESESKKSNAERSEEDPKERIKELQRRIEELLKLENEYLMTSGEAGIKQLEERIDKLLVELTWVTSEIAFNRSVLLDTYGIEDYEQ